MENPFETIMEKLNELEQQLNGLHKAIIAESPLYNSLILKKAIFLQKKWIRFYLFI
jgi:hypothetical protein